MFSTTEMASLQTLDVSTMVDRADIISKSRVSDGAGGSVVTPVITPNVPCRVKSGVAGAVESLTAGQLFSGLQWTFAFPLGTVITTDDEIVYKEQRFYVMAVTGPYTFETARIVLAVEK